MMEAKDFQTIPLRIDLLDPSGNSLQTAEYIKDKIVIGRLLSADFRIDDSKVSRIHALIEIRNGKIAITDLASTHGTFLNGKKIIEASLNFEDVIKLGRVSLRISKGSGQITAQPFPAERQTSDVEATQVDATRPDLVRDEGTPDDLRTKDERRNEDIFPDERRLEERRQGDRRFEERGGERRQTSDPLRSLNDERRSGEERRKPLKEERRLDERRKGDRRVFDITSLERRIKERRIRRGDDDVLPEELEKCFETPEHARELEVTAMWGDHILDVSNYYKPVVLSCGEAPGNHYLIPSEGIPDEFPLFTLDEDGNTNLAFTDEMTGTIRTRDKIYNLKDLKNESFVRRDSDYFVLSLKQDDFAKVNIGKVSFFSLYVKPAPRIKPAPLFDKDPLLVRTVVGSVLALLFLFVGLSFIKEPTPVTIEMIPERFVKIVVKPKPKIPPAGESGIVVPGEDNKQGGSKMGEGGRPMGEEGKLGKPELADKKEVPQAILPKSTPKDKPEIAKPKAPKETDKKVVDKSKIKKFGALKALAEGGVQKDIKALIDKGTGPEGAGGFDDFGKAVSGLRGKTIEEVGGAGGKGLKGVDAGGGGKTFGIDGPSTKGLGRGYYGDGIGEGIDGPGRLGMKGDSAISIVSDNVQVLSGLSKDVINAVVYKHRSEIRACYDAALQRNPKLKGKVSVAFNIQPNGIVSYAAVKESALADAGLDQCIVSRVKTWVFPKPEAPVVTEVTAYPFYLNPAN